MGTFGALTRLIRREPVTVQACVQATLALLVGFGAVRWTSEQVGLVMGAVAAFLALLTRAKVTPTRTIQAAPPGDRDQDAAGPAGGSGAGGTAPTVEAKPLSAG
ncbi:MAG TPA: hypothetical protein VFU43_12300 [Streptosporangiaceae bacterium]|nr:hypothetical protein [Streptosporangiaceae bacterium]